MTFDSANSATNPAAASVGFGLRLYLLLLAITLPMDWFSWTGNLLREAGARPAIPLMAAASAVIFLLHRNFADRLPKQTQGILLKFLLIGLCGMAAFFANIIFSWSYFGGSKDPITQAAAQFALFFLAPVLIVSHVILFRPAAVRLQLLKIIPIAAACHLVGLLLEAVGLLDPLKFPLSVFRLTGEIGPQTYRVAGLFSEPSYFGMMAAMYSLPLLLVRWPGKVRRILYAALALALAGCAFAIHAKTMVPVFACGLILSLWHSRTKIFTFSRMMLLFGLGAAFALMIISRSALNVTDNLSSAMRFGSTLTAIQVAASGYGWIGIGFGQFHFMFRPHYFPNFLFLSHEAIDASQRSAAHRASTYNLFARYLVETGVTGFILWILLLGRFARLAWSYDDEPTRFGMMLFGASVGFLLTQDPYCFPPLVVAMALILAAAKPSEHRILHGTSPS